ncbi:scavenger mRNA decapping enzyme [Cutaneotrichosporon oleaginosum]|uniref:Scavenger mRNA decapping enzyme n=1 Tax=Cutaneotrichosporon oleaginosum TaxID=879819 RepID=A0A0J0XNL7_9TREE|nr:scavenger mRNA decapping enzyme [Cutaneotrichosporon oleaginosum]KLT42672.1 scavenger mRNA decapping enzyme [Cutaneotrichosporon oleaginosum]TXT05212.1 hypothetical protein COLE_06532 [Cutaneotrichosporon oleaginosum]
MMYTMADTELKPCDLAALETFEFERVLMESTLTGSCYLLGRLHGEPAIVHVQRTAVDPSAAPGIVKEGLESLDVFLDNRPYFSAHALLKRGADALPDLALKLIWPCTDVHIKKYTPQPRRLLTETPELYASIVEPYIASFPPERTAWVHAIIEGRKEAERVLFSAPGDEGFTLLPDLKWDGVSPSALYLTAIARDARIRSLRDLRRAHVPLLRAIRGAAYAVCAERWGVAQGELRLFVHYQPSYYHFHVHVVHVAHEIMAGMAVGQAHMLEDIIGWLELSPEDGPSLLSQMAFTYALGTEHGLYAPLAARQEGEADGFGEH